MTTVERQIEVYSEPSGPTEEPIYRQQVTFSESGTLSVTLDGVTLGAVAVRQLLP